MSHEAVLRLLAYIFLVCATGVVIIDVAIELGLKSALRLKWSLTWYALRYTATVCGVLLAIDTLN